MLNENSVTVVSQNGSITSFVEIDIKAKDYIQQAQADNTRKAYRNDLQHFVKWCARYSLSPLPADLDTVVRYLTEMAEQGFKVATITRRISAISQAHQAKGLESPTHSLAVRKVMAGIRRSKGTAQNGKAPTMTEDIRSMVQALPDNLIGIRDAALLLLGFAGAFRRSELVSLDVECITFTREGLKVLLRRSKTDQDGDGMVKGIAYGSHPETCPVRAVQRWLESSGLSIGPLFRSVNRHGQMQSDRLSDKAVALVIKRQAKAAGLNPQDYAGHSLRAGHATSAAKAGAGERAIMKQTGHRSTAMVRRYIRMGSLFDENSSTMIGL